MQRVLILSGDYPNFGGNATTAYNLLKLLRQNDFDARLLCFTDAENANPDPENIGYSDILHTQKKRFFGNRDRVNPIRKVLYFSRLLVKLRSFFFEKKFAPHLVIAMQPLYGRLAKTILSSEKILVIVNGSPEMEFLARNSIAASSFIEGQKTAAGIINNMPRLDLSEMKVLFNSKLTEDVYRKLNTPTKSQAVQYFNLVPHLQQKEIEFSARRYDIAFVCSDFGRVVKNATLARQIFSSLGGQQKIAIGRSSMLFSGIENTETRDLMSQKELMDILSDTRLVIISSYFDSSPGLLSEAISCGANVLISQNVGWYEMLDGQCVVNNYNDLNEWLEKARVLLKDKMVNSIFVDMIKIAGENIVDYFKKYFSA